MRVFLYGSLVFLLLYHVPAAGQDRDHTDSLKALLLEEISDSMKTRVLLDLSVEYRYTDTARYGRYMDKALELAGALEDKSYLGRCYKIQGETDVHFGMYEEALICFDRALAFYNEARNNAGYYETLKDKGNVHLMRAEYDRALNYYETALDYYRRSGNGQGASRCLNNMGIVYKNRGQYVDALSAYDESIKIIEAEALPLQVAQGYINMGNVFVYLGTYERAMEYFENALELSEKSGSIKETALCLLNSGVVQNKCGNYREANVFYYRALKTGREIGDPVLISNSLINIGTNLGQMGQAEEGLQYVEQGKEIKEDLGDPRAISNCLIHLAELHFNTGNHAESKRLFEEALPWKTELEDPEGQIRCYLGLAQLANEGREFTRANSMADLALAIAAEIGALEHQAAAFAVKRDIAEERGDFRSAYNFALDYSSFNDSLMNEATARAVMEMEFRHRSKVLEKENENLKVQGALNAQLMKKRVAFMHSMAGIVIILLVGLLLVAYLLRRLKNSSLKLEEKNLVITKQNLKLDELNRNKDRMMSIIAHDLRGTMGNQITAIDVLGRIEGVENPDIDRKKLLGNLKLSASYSLELLENLLLWSRLEETEEYFKPETMSLDVVVSSCMAMGEEMAGRKDIELKSHIQPELGVFADRIMLETIIRNLLSNALKFSEKGGMVSISAKTSDCGTEIIVADRGIGMNKEDVHKLLKNGGFSRRGTDNEKGAGIGMTLVRELTTLHKGELEIESETGKGTSVRVCFPTGK